MKYIDIDFEKLKKPFEMPKDFKAQFLPLAAVEIKGFNPDNLTFENFISVEIPDRDEEIILIDKGRWERFIDTPAIGFVHFHDPNRGYLPIGGSLELRKEIHPKYNANGLVSKSQLVSEKTIFMDSIIKSLEFKPKPLLATSIGFIPYSWRIPIPEKDTVITWAIDQVKRICEDWELLEFSLCPVVSNFASTLKIKSWFKDGELEALGLEKYLLIEPKTMVIVDIDLKELEITKPLPNEHACRLRDPDDFQADSFRRIEREHEGKKYSVIMGRLKDEDTMTEQSYRYPKETWTVAQAKEHCTSHDGINFEPAKCIELEFAELISKSEKLEEENKLMRSALSDMVHQRNKLLETLDKEQKKWFNMFKLSSLGKKSELPKLGKKPKNIFDLLKRS
jgi:hypothetical protein